MRGRIAIADGVGFALGLGLAWFLGWRTTDLVWGLWLSSLVFGYATIVGCIVGQVHRSVAAAGDGAAGIVMAGFGGVFLLAFFSVHFGGFHFGHSVFLNMFFPPIATTARQLEPGWAVYRHVFASYWPWLVAAAFAERRTLVAAWRGGANGAFQPFLAYKNVVRMHLLIFFFAAVHAIGLDHFAVYAVVYAVYFWPWSPAPRPAAPAEA